MQSVSVIINNYNYGRYLRSAIESAIAQSYPTVEVIVVDDGSTDDSRQVMASFGERILPIYKANGGQASALNAGFANCRGEIVIFLDADDTLHPTVVERVVTAFCADLEAVRAQYRLEIIDAAGLPTGLLKPPRDKTIPCGDLLQPLLHYGDDICWLPTSGNAFCAEMLRAIFPIPESEYRICADFYLSNLSPLFGPIIALADVGGYYRIHDANHHAKETIDLQQTREIIIRSKQTHQYLEEKARELGLMDGSCETVAATSVTYLANRLLSLRLDPAHHPIAKDSRLTLMVKGMVAAWRRTDVAPLRRVLYSGWFFLTALAAKRSVRWLGAQGLRQ